MKLSIITCTYNSQQYLPQCLESILSQNINPDDYEHILVDGNSTDQTMAILEMYQKNNPQYHITIIQKKPQGVYNAMNEGIKIAKGKYVIFANSDDYREKNTFQTYLEMVIKQGCDIGYARMNIRSGETILNIAPSMSPRHHRLFFLGFNTAVYHPTTIIKKTLFDELGLYDETKKIASDYGFWLACIQAKKIFEYFPHVVTNFRVHPGSLTSNPRNKQKEWSENLYFRKKYLGWWGYCIQVVSLLFWGLGKAKSYLSNIKI